MQLFINDFHKKYVKLPKIVLDIHVYLVYSSCSNAAVSQQAEEMVLETIQCRFCSFIKKRIRILLAAPTISLYRPIGRVNGLKIRTVLVRVQLQTPKQYNKERRKYVLRNKL
jgi:hypothetical protein